MRNLTIFLLLFFINCSSQQMTTDKKYRNMDTIVQKYRNIILKYDSLVEKNRQNLTYEEGMYFIKSIYEKEKKDKNERWIDFMKSDAKFLLKEDDKDFFVEDEGQVKVLYTFQNKKLIEKARILKKNNTVSHIENFVEGTLVGYDIYENEKHIQLTHYIQDENDLDKRDFMLSQKYVNNELIEEINYKKDFKISKDQMLKKLPENFYNEAVKNILEEQKLKYAKNLGVVSLEEPLNTEIEELIKEKIKEVQKKLKTAIEVKDDFYKELRISKDYDKDNNPVYNLKIRMNHLMSWLLKIDGKTNKVLDIKLIKLCRMKRTFLFYKN